MFKFDQTLDVQKNNTTALFQTQPQNLDNS